MIFIKHFVTVLIYFIYILIIVYCENIFFKDKKIHERKKNFLHIESLNILNSKRSESDFVSLVRGDQVNSTIICASREFKNGLRT